MTKSNPHFERQPDAFLLERVRDTFGHLTGASRPVPKKKGLTHVDGNTLEDHFLGGVSWLSGMQFWNCFPLCVERGLLSPAEVAMGQQVMDELAKW